MSDHGDTSNTDSAHSNVDAPQATTQESQPSSLHPAIHLRDLTERVVFYVGVPAVTLYPVGALFYWIQLISHYHMDFESSWHAVLLIPRPFVIVEIARQLTLGGSATLTLMIMIAVPAAILFAMGWQRVWGASLTEHLASRLVLVMVMIAAIAGVWFLTSSVFSLVGNRPTYTYWYLPLAQAAHTVLSVTGGIFTGFLIARDYTRNRQAQDKARATLFVRRWLLSGALAAYSLSVVITLAWGGLTLPPQLPNITLNRSIEFSNDQAVTHGRLLSNPSVVCGYWQVLIVHRGRGEVVAISSSNAGKNVRVTSESG